MITPSRPSALSEYTHNAQLGVAVKVISLCLQSRIIENFSKKFPHLNGKGIAILAHPQNRCQEIFFAGANFVMRKLEVPIPAGLDPRAFVAGDELNGSSVFCDRSDATDMRQFTRRNFFCLGGEKQLKVLAAIDRQI